MHLYSPATNLEQSELEMLRSAKRSVDIARYSFTDRELADELVNLARSGVKIRVYRDRTEYQHEAERSDLNTTAMLIAAGIEVRVKGLKDLMHLKQYRADGCVRTGSANWSPTGLKRQVYDLRYECSPAAAEQFDREFEVLWQRASNLIVAGNSSAIPGEMPAHDVDRLGVLGNSQLPSCRPSGNNSGDARLGLHAARVQ